MNNITSKATIGTPSAFNEGSMRGKNTPTKEAQGTYTPSPKPDTTVSPIQMGQTETHYDEASSRPSIRDAGGKLKPQNAGL